jgi:hypothetical protein
MKAVSAPETWFMVVLGILALLELIICIMLGIEVWNYHGHDAALGQFGWLLLVAFCILTSSCLFWERPLLKMRTGNPTKSANAALVVFLLGMLPLVPLLWVWWIMI